MWSRRKHNPFVSAVFQLSSRAIDKRASSTDLFSVTRCFVLHSRTGSGDWVYCNSDEDRATGTAHVLNISSWSAYSHGETQFTFRSASWIGTLERTLWTSQTFSDIPSIRAEFEAVSHNERQISPSLGRRSDANRPKNPFLHLQSDNWHTLFASEAPCDEEADLSNSASQRGRELSQPWLY